MGSGRLRRTADGTVYAIGNKQRVPPVCFFEIILHASAQNDDSVRKLDHALLAKVNVFGSKPFGPFFPLPVKAMHRHHHALSKHLRQPAHRRRSFRMDMYHIVFSKGAGKRRKKAGAYRRDSFCLECGDIFFPDAFILCGPF